MEQGYIKLFRKFVNWQWYQDINTKTLFIHLLLEANHKDKEWQGITVKRGQIIIGLYSLSKDLGLSIQKIRTAIQKLKNTQEITIKSTNKYSIITIVNYNKYQINELELTNNSTNEQQTSNKQLTTNKNDKNIKNIKKKVISKDITKEKRFFEDVELNDLFIDFLTLRKKIKAVNSERAITTLLNILNNHSDEIKKEMINQSIVNSWKSIYELTNKITNKKPEWLGKNIEDERLTDEELETFKRKLAKK